MNVTYIQVLVCHLQSHDLYRHSNVTYIQTLEYYLRSHNLYTHLSLTPIQGAWVHFFHTGVWMTLYSHSLYRRLSVSLLTVLQKGVRRQYHEKVTVTLIPWDTTVFFFQCIRAGPRYVLVRWNRWEIHLAHPMKYYYTFSEWALHDERLEPLKNWFPYVIKRTPIAPYRYLIFITLAPFLSRFLSTFF